MISLFNTLDNVYLYDIDDLNNVVEMNKEQRDKEETLKFMRWLDGMEVTPTIVELQAAAESICRAELDKTLPRLGALGDKERQAVERLASAVAAKLLHRSFQYLRSEHDCVNRQERIAVVRSLFGLNGEELSAE